MYRLVSFAMLLISLHFALAMPDHPAGMRMTGELSHEVDQPNDTAANTTMSIEDSDESATDDDEDDDDDEINVQGKGMMCPEKQPNIAEIETQCDEETKKMDGNHTCMTVDSPTTEIIKTEKKSPEEAIIKLLIVTDMQKAFAVQQSRPRARVNYYYHCLLKKLDLLNEAEIPSKTKMESWIATNITDEMQREQTQHQLHRCLSQMKDEFEDPESSIESTEETEPSTEAASEKQDAQKCHTSKMLVCCLHRAECPVFTYP